MRTGSWGEMQGLPYYESSAPAREWFDRVLSSGPVGARVRAVRMLEVVRLPNRNELLARAVRDADQRVSVAARACIASSTPQEPFDLFESDFAAGDLSADLGWEWQYHVAVAHGLEAPIGTVVVWTACEGDDDARRIAVLRAYAGKEHLSAHAVPIIMRKALVCRYLRGPRNAAEALRWSQGHRPRYRE